MCQSLNYSVWLLMLEQKGIQHSSRMAIVRLKGRGTIIGGGGGEGVVATTRRCQTLYSSAAASLAVGVLYNLYIFGLCYEILEMLCISFK